MAKIERVPLLHGLLAVRSIAVVVVREADTVTVAVLLQNDTLIRQLRFRFDLVVA